MESLNRSHHNIIIFDSRKRYPLLDYVFSSNFAVSGVIASLASIFRDCEIKKKKNHS